MTFDATVELFISGSWVDVTRLDDETRVLGPHVRIARGAAGEQDTTAPTQVSLTLLDINGTFNDANPTSPYFGLLGRNTPLRVSMDGNVRAVVEVASWKPRWERNADGVDVIEVDVEADGILRRLGQGQKPLRTALERVMTANTPVAWWPLLDPEGSTSAASALPGGVSMGFDSNMRPGEVAGTELLGEGLSPEWCAGNGTTISGTAYGTLIGAVAGEFTIDFWLYAGMGHTSITDFGGVALSGTTLPGSACYFRVLNSAIDATNMFSFTFGLGDVNGSPETVFSQEILRGRWTHIRCVASQNGGNIDMELFQDGVSKDTDTYAGATLGTPTAITLGGFDSDANALASLSFRHLMFWATDAAPDVAGAGAGFAGEAAGERFLRLCGEENVSATVLGDETDTELMGPQTASTLLGLLQECASVDMGLLFEPRDSLGLTYRTRLDMINTDPVVDLTYGCLMPGLQPTDDDRYVRNDVTAKTPDGESSARVVIADDDAHHLTTQQPPTGVGTYDESITLNTYSAARLPFLAGWHAHIASWKAQRFPRLTMELAKPIFTGDAGLTADLVAADLGDVLSVDTTGAPGWVNTNPLDVRLLGYTEELSQFLWRFAANATPAGAYESGIIGASAGGTDVRGARISTNRSTLAEDLTTTETGVDVASVGILWTTNAAHFNVALNGGGLFVIVGGEVMRVTAISGASSPQTFTVVRSINGVVKTHLTGAPVRAYYPVTIGL